MDAIVGSKEGLPMMVSGSQYALLIGISLVLIWTLKLSVFFIGYKVVTIGARLLEQGIRGEFKFATNLQGVKADLRSSSPGALFLLLGIALIAVALVINMHVPFRQFGSVSVGQSAGPAKGQEIPLPANPFPEKQP